MTDEKVAEKKRRSTKILLTDENKELRRRLSAWRAIASLPLHAAAGNTETFLNEAVRGLALGVRAELIGVWLLTNDGVGLALKVSVGLDAGGVEPIALRERESLVEAARRGVPVWACPESLRSGGRGRGEFWNHSAFVEIAHRGTPLGVLCATPGVEREAFGDDELLMIKCLTEQVAAVLYNEGPARQMMARERLEREIQFVQALKAELQPQPPAEADAVVWGMRKYRCLEGGGDFHDFVPLTGGRWLALAGHISGRGLAAALTAAGVLVRARNCLLAGETLAGVFAALNRDLISRRGRGVLVNLAAVLVDPASGRGQALAAGNVKILQLEPGRVGELPPASGSPLGVIGDQQYAVQTLDELAGRSLVLVTDGLGRNLDAQGAPYGNLGLAEALERAARGQSGRPAAELIGDHFESACPGGVFAEDATVLSAALRV